MGRTIRLKLVLVGGAQERLSAAPELVRVRKEDLEGDDAEKQASQVISDLVGLAETWPFNAMAPKPGQTCDGDSFDQVRSAS